jgi:CHAT domain-containing protein
LGSFYRDLKNKGKIEALRRAQLEMIRGEKQGDLFARRGVGGIGKLGETPVLPLDAFSSGPDVSTFVSTSHPYFWAPFILVGDGD